MIIYTAENLRRVAWRHKSKMVELKPYQKTGVEWLVTKPLAILADDMGLGKTIQTIRAFDTFASPKRVAIVCPAVARINWQREFEKYSACPPEFDIAMDGKAELSPTRSLIISYDLLEALMPKIQGRFNLLIFDEAHFLKSPEAARTRAALGKSGLVRKADRVWALSGTPAPNGYASELWVWLRTFGVTALSYADFVDRYCDSYRPHPRSEKRVTGTKAHMVPELKKMLAPIMLRRRKEEVLTELPELSWDTIVVEPSPVDIECDAVTTLARYVLPISRLDELNQTLLLERQLLQTVADKVKLGDDGFKVLQGMYDSVSTLRAYMGLQKVQAVADLVTSELKSKAYKKIVIFAIHRDVIDGLRRRLVKFRPVTLYGATPPRKRQRFIDMFQTEDRCKVFIGNIKACGTAITLTASDQVLFIEQSWVPGENAQAAMRVHRIGQTRPVFVRFVTLNDPLEERIALALRKKSKLIRALFDPVPLQSTTPAGTK